MADSLAKVIYKELQAINRKSVFDDTATVVPVDEDNPLKMRVTLTPQEGIYKGGTFEFDMDVPTNYPSTPPKIVCKTKLYHPNIRYEDGQVCLSMLSEPNSNYRLEHYVNGLLFLFQHPNVDSRLNSMVTPWEDDLRVIVKGSLLGLRVGSMTFPKMISEPMTKADLFELLLCGLSSVSGAGPGASVSVGSPCEVFPLGDLLEFAEQEQGFRKKLLKFFPFVERLDKACGASIHVVDTTLSSVPRRAQLLSVPEASVVKEMVLMVGSEPALFLTCGGARVDCEQLSRSLQKGVEVARVRQIRHLINGSLGNINAFRFEGKMPIFASESLMQQPHVFTSALNSNILLRISPGDLARALPTLVLVPTPAAAFPPAPPASKAPVADTPPSPCPPPSLKEACASAHTASDAAEGAPLVA